MHVVTTLPDPDDRPSDLGATAPKRSVTTTKLNDLIAGYVEDYQVRQFRSRATARGRVAHLAAFFGRETPTASLTTCQIRPH